MRVTIILIVPGTFGFKGMETRLGELGMRGRMKTIPTTALLRSAWIFRKVLETRENFSKKIKTGLKNSQRTQ